MSLFPKTEPIPISHNVDGVAIVTGTRIPIDTVIYTFLDGATPEQIAHKFPVLQLGQIYMVIAYYLNHRAEVDEYVEQRRANAEAIRHENEKRSSSDGIRERLLARKQRSEGQP